MKRSDDFIERDLRDVAQSGEGKYFLVNVLAKRAKSLNMGSRPVVKVENGRDLDDIALQEAVEGKLDVKPKKRVPKMVDIVETNNK